MLRLHLALETWEAQAKEQLLLRPAIHVDETSLRVDQKNHWIPVDSASDITLKCLHRKRGKEAIESINLIPRYGGAIIHDCWSSYFAYSNCGHGLCGSHLLRELTFIVDAHGYRWAKQLKRLLQETCINVSSRPEKQLKSNKRSPAASGLKTMRMPIVEYPAICKPWLTRDIIRSSLFK
ncbi:MAG: transposase [Methylococcaceae bacterium]|nr:transposase [Methylococcaceae bacterium]